METGQYLERTNFDKTDRNDRFNGEQIIMTISVWLTIEYIYIGETWLTGWVVRG